MEKFEITCNWCRGEAGSHWIVEVSSADALITALEAFFEDACGDVSGVESFSITHCDENFGQERADDEELEDWEDEQFYNWHSECDYYWSDNNLKRSDDLSDVWSLASQKIVDRCKKYFQNAEEENGWKLVTTEWWKEVNQYEYK